MPIYRITRREVLVLEVHAEDSVKAAALAYTNYSWDLGREIVTKEIDSVGLDVEYLRADPPGESTPATEVPAPVPAADPKAIPF